MDYVDAATTGTLSPHILSIADLKQMLSHIEESLHTTMHLPVSSEDTLHLYRYLHTNILIANRQFLLPIGVPIQDWTQQILIYRIFTLDIPMEILQHIMKLTLNTLELHRMKLWQ